MKFEEFKKILLSNKAFRDEFEKSELERSISYEILEARTRLGITQRQLAKMVGTKQPSIARLERGERTPSISFLKKIATAFKTKLYIGFEINRKESTINITFDAMPFVQNDNLLRFDVYSKTRNNYQVISN